jgi:DNA-binding NarL/FixJ family response regulator
MIRVLLVDDESLIRAGFRMLLEAEPDITVVGEANDGEQGLSATVLTVPDVVLMDVRMPIVDGVEATRRIAADARLGEVKVLMVTTFHDHDCVLEALNAGASGFLVKNTSPADLVGAVRVVAAGQALLSPAITRHLIEDVRAHVRHEPVDAEQLTVLTHREREVMSLVAAGLCNDDIARRLFITPATAKTHLGRTLAKLGLRSRAQLVALAYETGLVVAGRGQSASPRQR